MTRTVPGVTKALTLRIASVPADHVYVRHLGAPDGTDRVADCRDPVPDDPVSRTGQWWPPRMLDARLGPRAPTHFDVFHVHFGFDAQSAEALAALVAELRRCGKRLVYTVHDLRNPHHPDARRCTTRSSDVLVPAADAVITLTPGAAAEIARALGREAPTCCRTRTSSTARRCRGPADRRRRLWSVGLHAKSLRASMDPLRGRRRAGRRRRATCPARGCRSTSTTTSSTRTARGTTATPVAACCAARGGAATVELRVHDYFSDDELWDYLSRSTCRCCPTASARTRAGWRPAATWAPPSSRPTCGYYAEQRPVLDLPARRDGSRRRRRCGRGPRPAYEQRPRLRGRTWTHRRDERAALAAAHRDALRAVLR